MDRIIAVEPPETGQPLRSVDLVFMQEADNLQIKAILVGFGANRCIVSGLITSNLNPINVSDGDFFDGEEICHVNAAQFNKIPGAGLYLTKEITTSEERVFKDGSPHDVYEHRKYVLGYSTELPNGVISLVDMPRMLNLISDFVISQMPPAASGGIDLKEKRITFTSDNLAQYIQLIASPGPGKSIKVISCVAFNKITNRVECGTQRLNVTYGADTTTSEIGYFSNMFIEYPTNVISDMIPSPGLIYADQAVSCGLSFETRPTSGSSEFTIYLLYKIIEF